MELKQKYTLSGAALKWIALVTMLLDHIGLALVYLGYLSVHRIDRAAFALPLYYALRTAGRLAFPIYCFLLAEGACHTRDRGHYLLRLLAFGLLSEIPFDLAFNRTLLEIGSQNVYFTLAIGLLAILLWEALTKGDARACRLGWRLLAGLGVLGCMALAWLLKTDYGALGVLLVFVLYLLRERVWLRDLAGLAVLGLMVLVGGSHWVELIGGVSLLLLHRYNGRRGRQPKYLFYLFYPAHLLLLALIRYAVWGI